MDSPARNPSPPPELRDHAELLEAERIGNTAFSKHWLFTTLMKLIEVTSSVSPINRKILVLNSFLAG